MATFSGIVGAGADNGYVESSASDFNANNNLVFGDFGSTHFSCWARWTNVTIPQGATINSVTVTIQSVNGLSGDTCNVNIYFDNEDNALAPTTYSGFTGKPVTSAVAWNSVPHFVTDTDYTLPDLASILQTVINRAGWASGNALQLFIKSTITSNFADRQAKDFTTDSVNCARISINYTAGVTAKNVTFKTLLGIGNI